jgi:predicted dehydrogenase
MTLQPEAGVDRRDLFKAAVGGGLLLLKPQTVFGSQANSTVEMGLIGCGGRGNWLAPFFPEFTGARIVALADVVKSKIASTAEKLKVDSSRFYHGPDAHKELSNSKVDGVIIETPPYYHPIHAATAVAAGKHVFCAKPVAVDVPSAKDFLAAGEKAKQKGLSFWVDFQSRAQPIFQEVASRIHRGDLGKVALAQVFYYANRPWKDRATPEMEPGQKRMANWLGDRVISGDIIVEQNIHVIDMANWFLGGHPLKANGTGGRTDWSGTQSNVGDAWDHFVVSYWYPNDTHATFSSHQLVGGLNDLCVRCVGLHGTADTHYGGAVKIVSPEKDVAWNGTEKDDTFKSGCVANIKSFIEGVRTGRPVNNATTAVESNLTSILGRTAAYEQRTITWDEMMRSTDRWKLDLALKWS